MCLCACPCAVSFSLFANFTATASNLSGMVHARCFLNDVLAPRWQDAGLNLLITLAVLLKVTLLVNHSRPCLIHSMGQLVAIWQREPHSTKLHWLSPSEECLGNPWGLKGNFPRVFWPGVAIQRRLFPKECPWLHPGGPVFKSFQLFEVVDPFENPLNTRKPFARNRYICKAKISSFQG